MASRVGAGCWGLVIGGSATGSLLLVAAALLPAVQGPVTTLAVAVLAAAGAFATDEPAAAVVDATPTSTRRRTLYRVPLLAPPLAVGVAGLSALHLSAPAHLGGAAPLSLGLWVLLAFTAAACARTRIAAPGEPVAVVVAVVIMTMGLWNPLHRWIPVLAVDPASSRLTARVCVVAVPVLVAALTLVTAQHRWRCAPVGSGRSGGRRLRR